MKAKKLYFILISALFLVVLTACGGTTADQDESEPEENEVDETEESAVQDSPETESDADADVETDSDTEDSSASDDQGTTSEPEEEQADGDDQSENADVETVKEEATYNGQGDPHTIEVKTADSTIALQITAFMDDDWSSVEPGTPMTIEYYENEAGQLILANYSME
ncbi:hypothetical protein [Oceanobacillus saliphilus]|uniref:hypothetical protein n=1 Tax=Oceanobacillus saliphilus TaxID=2925834 RepID=UPI00201DCAD6|nr:hypothetical protein [Oceanobacillus saliphilus]